MLKRVKKYFADVLNNIQSYSSLFKKTFKIIVENGSSDDTKKILKSMKMMKASCILEMILI